MARIKINNLPKDHKVSRAEMKQVLGGLQIQDGLPVIGSMSEMDMLNLQQAQQGITQTTQMMTNLSRYYHELSKSIINNFRA